MFNKPSNNFAPHLQQQQHQIIPPMPGDFYAPNRVNSFHTSAPAYQPTDNNPGASNKQPPSSSFNAFGPIKYLYESNPTMSEAEPIEVSGKILCKDMNGEFCASIAVKPDYCSEDFLVNNKTIKELCKCLL
jgi:hypothetical protein